MALSSADKIASNIDWFACGVRIVKISLTEMFLEASPETTLK